MTVLFSIYEMPRIIALNTLVGEYWRYLPHIHYIYIYVYITHIHTHIYMYIYIYICVCVCACVCVLYARCNDRYLAEIKHSRLTWFFWFIHLDKCIHVPSDSHNNHMKIGTDKVNSLAFRTSSQNHQILTAIVSVTCSALRQIPSTTRSDRQQACVQRCWREIVPSEYKASNACTLHISIMQSNWAPTTATVWRQPWKGKLKFILEISLNTYGFQHNFCLMSYGSKCWIQKSHLYLIYWRWSKWE